MKAFIQPLLPVILLALTPRLSAHPDAAGSGTNQPPAQSHSRPGPNVWNEAEEPADWWGEIKRVHGHVGPWNVLGWRMGQAARRELNATWGRHDLDIVCHVPLATPYSCLADGLVVGTGNSLGRLDLRLAEVMAVAEIHVSVRRKDGTGPVLLLKPEPRYLEKIRSRPVEELEALSHETARLPEAELFTIRRLPQLPNNAD
jgi:formylmethanofuran dehydrogenase subunit E